MRALNNADRHPILLVDLDTCLLRPCASLCDLEGGEHLWHHRRAQRFSTGAAPQMRAQHQRSEGQRVSTSMMVPQLLLRAYQSVSSASPSRALVVGGSCCECSAIALSRVHESTKRSKLNVELHYPRKGDSNME